MKNKILILTCVILLLLVARSLFALSQLENKFAAVSPAVYWNKSIAEKFDDEPKLEGYNIASSSAWTIPTDPNVINQSYAYDIGQTEKEKSEIEKTWNLNPYMKEGLDKFIKDNALEDKYHNFFYLTTQMPRAFDEYDVTGDGTKEKIFINIGVGCASCHIQYVSIFAGDTLYETHTNEGAIFSRSDGKGFYITYAQTGDDPATCCPDNIVLSKYEWHGKGFTEIARKRVYVKK